MKKLILSLSLLLLACSAGAQVVAAWRVDHAAVMAEFLRVPPAAASEEERRDLEELLALQGGLGSVKPDGSSDVRTITDCRDANKQRLPGMKWFFGPRSGVQAAEVLSDKELLLVANLGERLISEASRVSKIPKEQQHRVRPYNARPDVIRSCAKPLPEPQTPAKQIAGKSFPSSHAAMGRLMGEVFAEIFPRKADVIRAQGARIGYLRKRVGVHYPSDVAAGEEIGDLMLLNLKGQAAFRAEVAALKEAAEKL
jgi:acid phosphatase (class A)